jgi:hypothetical protein
LLLFAFNAPFCEIAAKERSIRYLGVKLKAEAVSNSVKAEITAGGGKTFRIC